ncbi:MAG: IMP dehydrogenase, partial [Phycisphaerales bacterium]|nr:IMP dehydrogenase [Phycisphaerales bacterium]
MEKLHIPDGITFDDVLLVPRFSEVTPDIADTSTRLTNRISLNIPLISAPMDTVTESSLAIALAQEGGIGFVHKNMPPMLQAREVAKVKRSENGVITDPVTLSPEDSIRKAMTWMEEQNVSGFPVTLDGEGNGEVVGILTRRDMKFVDSDDQLVGELMTSSNLITGGANTTLEGAEAMMVRARVEKLILIDDANKLNGLITMRDIENIRHHPKACRDSRGRLRVGAAVGVHQFDRVEALIEAEVDVIVVDTAHGHSQNVLDTVKEIKSRWDIDVIAGNIATTEGAQALIDAG